MSAPDWRGFVLPTALLVVAEIAMRALDVRSDSIAPPSAIAQALAGAFADGSLPLATGQTLLAMTGGLAIGGAFGTVLGLAFGLSPRANRLMEATIETIRPIPAVAILPIALIALGFGYRMEMAIVAFATCWPLLILTRAAVAGVETRLLEVACALRLGPVARVAKVVLPAALPRIFVAFRLAAGVALIVAVTVEIAINPLGLGAAIMTAQQALRPDLMLGCLVWIGFVGYGLNWMLLALQRRFFPHGLVEPRS